MRWGERDDDPRLAERGLDRRDGVSPGVPHATPGRLLDPEVEFELDRRVAEAFQDGPRFADRASGLQVMTDLPDHPSGAIEVGSVAVVDGEVGAARLFQGLPVGLDQHDSLAPLDLLVGQRQSEAAAADDHGAVDCESKPAGDPPGEQPIDDRSDDDDQQHGPSEVLRRDRVGLLYLDREQRRDAGRNDPARTGDAQKQFLSDGEFRTGPSRGTLRGA